MNEQLLREQIVELTKLLELKDMRIKELEALRSIPTVFAPFIAPYSIDNTSGVEQTIQVTTTSGGCVCGSKCGSK